MRLASGVAKVKAIDPSHSPALILARQENRPGTAASARSRKKSLRGMVTFECVEEVKEGSMVRNEKNE